MHVAAKFNSRCVQHAIGICRANQPRVAIWHQYPNAVGKLAINQSAYLASFDRPHIAVGNIDIGVKITDDRYLGEELVPSKDRAKVASFDGELVGIAAGAEDVVARPLADVASSHDSAQSYLASVGNADSVAGRAACTIASEVVIAAPGHSQAIGARSVSGNLERLIQRAGRVDNRVGINDKPAVGVKHAQHQVGRITGV